jgi:hypothetical protein
VHLICHEFSPGIRTGCLEVAFDLTKFAFDLTKNEKKCGLSPEGSVQPFFGHTERTPFFPQPQLM